jgi:5'-deoxynucleotidase YfbR-like HD superfamily hydrolase
MADDRHGESTMARLVEGVRKMFHPTMYGDELRNATSLKVHLQVCGDVWEYAECTGDDAHICVQPEGHADKPIGQRLRHKCSCGAMWSTTTSADAPLPDITDHRLPEKAFQADPNHGLHYVSPETVERYSKWHRENGRCGEVKPAYLDQPNHYCITPKMGDRHAPGHPRQHRCGCGYVWETIQEAVLQGAPHSTCRELLEGGMVMRYHAEPGVPKTQTVADHTWRAMLLMARLWPEHTHNALLALLYHDVAERYTGDCPHPVKLEFDDVRRALDKAEDAINVRFGIARYFDDLTDEEAAWVRACDWLEAALWCLDLVVAGNKHAGAAHNKLARALRKLGDRLPEAIRREHDAAVQARHLDGTVDSIKVEWLGDVTTPVEK